MDNFWDEEAHLSVSKILHSLLLPNAIPSKSSTEERISTQLNTTLDKIQQSLYLWNNTTLSQCISNLTPYHLEQMRTDLPTAFNSNLKSPQGIKIISNTLSKDDFKHLCTSHDMYYSVELTLFGYALVGIINEQVCHLSFIASKELSSAHQILQLAWPDATLTLDKQHNHAIYQYLSDQSLSPTEIKILLVGTPFQVSVWQSLLAIPKGNLMSYSDIAEYMNKPKAQRAVGSAIGKNTLALLIPCHRVIRRNGEIGQYRWGIERKAAIILTEQPIPSQN
jgi:AraC family transcriptional regulator of adaptative response/methylated-DNA-[protein]-cysteine methyltransferase